MYQQPIHTRNCTSLLTLHVFHLQLCHKKRTSRGTSQHQATLPRFVHRCLCLSTEVISVLQHMMSTKQYWYHCFWSNPVELNCCVPSLTLTQVFLHSCKPCYSAELTEHYHSAINLLTYFLKAMFYPLLLTGSMKNMRHAAVKLMPTPPAFNDSRKTAGEWESVSENASMAAERCLLVIVPSRRTK